MVFLLWILNGMTWKWNSFIPRAAPRGNHSLAPPLLISLFLIFLESLFSILWFWEPPPFLSSIIIFLFKLAKVFLLFAIKHSHQYKLYFEELRGLPPLVRSCVESLAWIQISSSLGMKGKRAPAANWHLSHLVSGTCTLLPDSSKTPPSQPNFQVSTQVTAWNSQAYLPWLPITSSTARSGWPPCYFPQIANSFLCCVFAHDVLRHLISWQPSAEHVRPSKTLGS